MFESYLSKIVITLVGAAAGIVGIAGGYYALFQVVTLVGN